MKEKILNIIKIVISVLIMFFLLKRVDVAEFREVLSDTGPFIYIVAAAIYIFSVFLTAVKWHVILPDTALGFLTYLSFRAQLYSTVLPGQLFGEASKIASWHKKEDVMKVTASVFFDKITGMIGQVILAVVGLSFSQIGRQSGNTCLFLFLGAAFICLVLVSTERHIKDLICRLLNSIKGRQEKIGCRLCNFYSAWCCFSTDKGILAKSVLWGIINQFMGILMIWFVSEMLALHIGIMDYCWIMPALSIILLIPISFAGIGLRDASLASMLAIYGVAPGNSLIISAIWLLGQVLSAVIGGVMMIIVKWK